VLDDSQERAFVNRNAARELRRGEERQADRRQRQKLKVEVDIAAGRNPRRCPASNRWLPLTTTLRADGRGRTWISPPESAICASARRPASPLVGNRRAHRVLNALREWLACPKGELDLVPAMCRNSPPFLPAAGVTAGGRPTYAAMQSGQQRCVASIVHLDEV
jgi:hypothetical protein